MIGSIRLSLFSEKEFWKIMGMLDWHFVGEDENVIKRATLCLSKKSDNFIKKFHQMLLQKLRALEVCNVSFGMNKSAQSFLNTRCSVIAAGKKYYDSVLLNPSKIKENAEFKALTKLCNNAISLKQGDQTIHVSVFKYYSGSAGMKLS